MTHHPCVYVCVCVGVIYMVVSPPVFLYTGDVLSRQQMNVSTAYNLSECVVVV